MLRAYAIGDLDDPASQDVEAHVQDCVACCERLRELSHDDEFVGEVRAALDDLGDANDLLPRRLGKFRLERMLGEGAIGVVFEAYDERLHRRVAIKTPRLGTLATSELRARFLREARIAAGLEHANVLPVYEAGEEAGT